MKKDIVIVDIDGTIAKIGDRLKYLQQDPKDWDSFYEHCDEDEPIEDIIRLVQRLHFCGYNIVFCTGRRESVRNKTIEWIKKHLGFESWHYRLLMRKDNDTILYVENETPSVLPQIAGDCYAGEIEYFVKSIVNDTPNTVNSPESACATVKLIEALRESAARDGEKIVYTLK